jgi:hypothetical protein
MMDKERLRERFMRDPLPRRLGGLAATLGRISSSARKSSDPAIVSDLLDEARRLIEWTAGETMPEVAAELVQIQIMLTVWQKAWRTASENPNERLLLSLQAKDWSDKAVDFSGLA